MKILFLFIYLGIYFNSFSQDTLYILSISGKIQNKSTKAYYKPGDHILNVDSVKFIPNTSYAQIFNENGNFFTLCKNPQDNNKEIVEIVKNLIFPPKKNLYSKGNEYISIVKNKSDFQKYFEQSVYVLLNDTLKIPICATKFLQSPQNKFTCNIITYENDAEIILPVKNNNIFITRDIFETYLINDDLNAIKANIHYYYTDNQFSNMVLLKIIFINKKTLMNEFNILLSNLSKHLRNDYKSLMKIFTEYCYQKYQGTIFGSDLSHILTTNFNIKHKE